MIFADVHCHILFGVDDGAKDEEEMYEMLDAAYEAGVRVLCATPHCNPEMFKYDRKAEAAVFEKLSEYTASKYPDMSLFHANEVFVYADLPSVVAEKKRAIFPDNNTVLIEFFPGIAAKQIETTVMLLSQLGYTPLLAHVERYPALKKKILLKLQELGAMISVNADSIIGEHGRLTQKHVIKLLSAGLVNIVASDSHKKETFSHLKKAYEYLSKKFDEEWLDELFYHTPKSLLSPNNLT